MSRSLRLLADYLKSQLNTTESQLRSLNYWRARHTGVTQSKIGDVYWRASIASETVLGVDNAKSGICYWRASVASETVLGVDNAKSGICYWRASVASETLTGVTQSKIGDVSLFICIYVWTYVRHFCTLTLAFLC